MVQYYCNEPYYSLLGSVNGEYLEFLINVFFFFDVKYNLVSSESFACEADRKWRAINDVGLIPTCIPGINLFAF